MSSPTFSSPTTSGASVREVAQSSKGCQSWLCKFFGTRLNVITAVFPGIPFVALFTGPMLSPIKSEPASSTLDGSNVKIPDRAARRRVQMPAHVGTCVTAHLLGTQPNRLPRARRRLHFAAANLSPQMALTATQDRCHAWRAHRDTVQPPICLRERTVSSVYHPPNCQQLKLPENGRFSARFTSE